MTTTLLTMLYKTPCSTDRGGIKLSGEFTESLYERMSVAMDNGGIDGMFIPAELSLTSPADEVIAHHGYEAEHDFAGVYIEELHNADSFKEFSRNIVTVEDADSPVMAVSDFVERLEQANYDEDSELARMQSLTKSDLPVTNEFIKQFADLMPEIVTINGQTIADLAQQYQGDNVDVAESFQSMLGELEKGAVVINEDLHHFIYDGMTPEASVCHSFSEFCIQYLPFEESESVVLSEKANDFLEKNDKEKEIYITACRSLHISETGVLFNDSGNYYTFYPSLRAFAAHYFDDIDVKRMASHRVGERADGNVVFFESGYDESNISDEDGDAVFSKSEAVGQINIK